MSWSMVMEHLFMVLMAVLFTIALGVPLGVCAYCFKPLRRVVLWSVEILQTIPAMALLGIIMVFLGAGKATVVIGLLLYALMPVVQNTCLGLTEVDPGVREVARGMGMMRFYRLLHVEMPIAIPYIFTGIRIAVVISVGVAVFATFVGGGGIGRAIYQAIRVHDVPTIISSTFTLMLMAIGLDTVMALAEKRLYSRFSPAEK